MSVFKQAGSPYYHFDFQVRGQRSYGSTSCTSKRDAEEFERRERQKAVLPNHQRSPITLDDACGLYASRVMDGPSWPTIKYLLSELSKGLGKGRLLSDITQRCIQTFFSSRRKSRSNATVNREIENARAVWRYADRNRYDVGEMPDWKVTPTALRGPFSEALKVAGIVHFRLHDLRHTRGTRIVRQTGSLAAAKEALKHKSISTTLRYAHVLDDDTRRALDESESRNSPEPKRGVGVKPAQSRAS